MLSKKKDTKQKSMFFGLEDMLNQKHPMYILANKVNQQLFEDSFSFLYCLDNGRPAKLIRLMVGLLILKVCHLSNWKTSYSPSFPNCLSRPDRSGRDRGNCFFVSNVLTGSNIYPVYPTK